VLLRILGPDKFGYFAVTLAAISLVASILSLRLGIIIIRTAADNFTPVTQRRYFNGIVAETAVVAVVSIGWLVASGRDTALDFMLVASVIVQNFCGHNRAYWERSMPYKTAAIVETCVVAFSQLAGVAIVLITRDVAALYVRELVAALALLAGLALVGGLTWHRLQWLSTSEWKSLLREARGIWLDSVLEGVFQRLTVLTTAAVAGDRGAGLFSMAQRIAGMPHQVLMPLGRVAITWFGHAAKVDRRRTRDQLLIFLGLILALTAAVVISVADPVVPWLFGAHWTEAVPALIAMSGGIVFLTLFEVTRGYSLVVGATPVLIAGRLAQFSGFVFLSVLAWLWPAQSVELLGFGLSLAFALAFLVQFALLRRLENS
jgi:O-antigen/teichoic acid export membrane protein